MDERQTNSVEPEPQAEWNPDLSGARADCLRAARSAIEQEKRCPNISQTAYLGLGSNLGDRMGALRAAIHALDHHDAIRIDRDGGIAPVYETSPVGGPPDQPLYLNTAVRITTTLDPYALLKVVLSIEHDLGRVRGKRWSARTIDIDILFYGQLTLDDEVLTVPHPRLHERLFVLVPLCDIALDLTHPRIGMTVRDIVARLGTSENGKQTVRLFDQDWYAQPTVDALPKAE